MDICMFQAGDTFPAVVSTVVIASDASSSTEGSFPHSRKGTAYLRNYRKQNKCKKLTQDKVYGLFF